MAIRTFAAIDVGSFELDAKSASQTTSMESQSN